MNLIVRSTDLVATYKGQSIAIKVQFTPMLGMQLGVFSQASQQSDWVCKGILISMINDADLKSLGPIEYIKSMLAEINAALRNIFLGAPATDPYAQLEAALGAHFKLVVDGDSVTLVGV